MSQDSKQDTKVENEVGQNTYDGDASRTISVVVWKAYLALDCTAIQTQGAVILSTDAALALIILYAVLDSKQLAEKGLRHRGEFVGSLLSAVFDLSN